MLSLHNIAKQFDTSSQMIDVLSHISIKVESGEFVSIIGPSGCGKSTLFHIIAGLQEQTSGTITRSDHSQNNRLGTTGYMLQKPLLLPWKTVEENIMLGLLIKHEPREQARKQAIALLQRFHLEQFAHEYPATLSGGMAQKVALLRTVLFNNTFLLLDEPFGALDALTRLSMQMWLQELCSIFTSSVLFITHDIREALLLSDRIYVLTSRPARVLREFQVPLPRPRKRLLLSEKKIVQLEQTLENLLLEEHAI